MNHGLTARDACISAWSTSRPGPVAETVEGTVSGMDKTDPVYDTEDPTDDGEQWDDEERDRE
ncbi:hypothetical protein [Mycobacteroides abscessus]|uniref:hypothetical protein n=1 Tax=Mycobacteroides abscessus TaxID=36809 RepID=UPI00092CD1AB|nr:hypothetical protein [Mycobacteroides abscessus]SIH15618.1 Uncharacterised protein [Mycobacteroides abscessus subsp. abscessus]